jgi:hypothetical protein
MLTQNQYRHQPPGMLVKLLRLNVPCTSGGFIRFNGTIQLCGKLEELTESQRTFYFHSFSNTSFSIYNYPKFYFIYKLVDYCYNITMLDRNSSFSIQPTSDFTLKCHFKIHLPYGNEIALKLRLKGNTDVPTTAIREIHMAPATPSPSTKKGDDERDFSGTDDAFIELENYSPNSDSLTFLSHAKIDCEWIHIEIINRMNERWSECLREADTHANFEFKLSSSDNVLLIRMTKKQTQQHQQRNTENAMITLEYSARPIERVVSQCAFGWILVGQFCMAPFDELLTWESAESRCNDLGGHLASISHDNEQHSIDMMLINR